MGEEASVLGVSGTYPGNAGNTLKAVILSSLVAGARIRLGVTDTRTSGGAWGREGHVGWLTLKNFARH